MEKITNAIKDTVSVLYWYEELSSSQLAIFGTVLRNFFCVPGKFPPPKARAETSPAKPQKILQPQEKL